MTFRTAIIVAIFLAIQTAVTAPVQAQTAGVRNCSRESECRLEYDHLATQETDPFLFSGHLMDKEQPRWQQYRKALRRFPDVRDCLVRAERDKPEPNLLLIDWSRAAGSADFEVCLFRIARSVGSSDRILTWLKYHEFRMISASRFRNDTYQSQFENDPEFYVQASWSKEYKQEVHGKPWFDLFPDATDTVSIQFNSNMEVVGVHAGTTTK